MPWAGQPSGVSPEETAEGPSRGLRGPCCYPDTPRLGPALRLPTGTLRARFSRCSRLQQRHRSLSILSHGRGGEGDDWRLLRLPVLTRSHTSRGAAHASELRRRALPPAFVSAPFFLPLGGSGGGGGCGAQAPLPAGNASPMLLPFLPLSKFYLPSKAQFKYRLLRAVFLDLPLPRQLFCTAHCLYPQDPWSWKTGTSRASGLSCLRYTPPSPSPHARGFRNKGPDTIKIQLNLSLL